MIFLVKVELQESQRKKTKKQADAAFVSLVVQFQQAMKISSLWVAGNPLLPREVASFCSLGTQVKWFHSKFSQFKVLIRSSQVSAFWFHTSCLSPQDFMCAVWTVFDLVVSPYQGLREHLCISAIGDSWDAHRHGEPAAPCSARGTCGSDKLSPGVSPGHSPEGKCSGVGSKPPFWLTTHCAGLPGATVVLQHGCALDEDSTESSSQVQHRNIFLKPKRKC